MSEEPFNNEDKKSLDEYVSDEEEEDIRTEK